MTFDKLMLKQSKLPCAGLQNEDVLEPLLKPKAAESAFEAHLLSCHRDPIWPKTKAQPLFIPLWASGRPGASETPTEDM